MCFGLCSRHKISPREACVLTAIHPANALQKVTHTLYIDQLNWRSCFALCFGLCFGFGLTLSLGLGSWLIIWPHPDDFPLGIVTSLGDDLGKLWMDATEGISHHQRDLVHR